MGSLDIVTDILREMQRNVEFIQRQMDHISRRVDDLNAVEKRSNGTGGEDRLQFK